MRLIMLVLPYRLVMTSGINVPYYACLTISAGNDLRNYWALLGLSYTISGCNDLRYLMGLIRLVLPYRLVMTSGINAPYYACLTISAGNDVWN